MGEGLVIEPGRAMPIAAGMRLPDLRDEVPARDVVALTALLADVEAADAPSMDLLARAAGWDQVIAMAQAAQARLVGELAARREVGPDRVVDELQCALGCTQYGARRLVLRAKQLGDHPALADALGAGDLDLRRVDAVLDALPVGGDPGRWQGVVAAVLADATLWSAPALRRQTERLVLAAEPAEAEARCRRARAGRCVRLGDAGDAMAWVSALLPAPDAVAVYTVVDALAGTHRHDGDDRTVDQRRADAFTAVFTTILDTGATPDGTALPRRHGRRSTVQVTVGAGTLLGLDDLPGELAGYGPIPADLARTMAQDGTWRRLLTDPATGMLVERGDATYRPGADLTGTVITRDVTCTYPYCGQPAWRCELDHVDPFDPDRPADEQTTESNLEARCKHHHDLKTSGGWTVRRDPATGSTRWTDPFGITFIRLAMPVVLGSAALARLFPATSHPPPGSGSSPGSSPGPGSGPGGPGVRRGPGSSLGSSPGPGSVRPPDRGDPGTPAGRGVGRGGERLPTGHGWDPPPGPSPGYPDEPPF